MTISESMQILHEFAGVRDRLQEPSKQKKNYFFVGHLFAHIALNHIAVHVASESCKTVLGPLWIKGLERVQWDGALFKKEAHQIFERYYKPKDVIALFEFKTSGVYGTKRKKRNRKTVKEVVKEIRKNFGDARKLCPSLKDCFYIALHERTPKRSGSINYFNEVKKLKPTAATCTLFDSKSLEKGREPIEYPNEWSGLLEKLSKL